MRAPAVPALALALALPAYSGTESAPLPPGSPRGSVAGLETVAARNGLVSFLSLYADVVADTEALSGLVAGPHLKDWVHWVGVQNAGLEGRLSGELSLRGVRILQIGAREALAAVDATVSFRVREEDGGGFLVPRRFESPARLVRQGGGLGWSLVDVIRDGRSMQDAITVLDPPVAVSERDVRVMVVSVYRFSSGTVVNIRIGNASGHRLRLDLQHSILQVRDRFLGGDGASLLLRAGIRSGRSVEGALNFRPVPLSDVPQEVILRLSVGGRERDLAVALPQEAFLADL